MTTKKEKMVVTFAKDWRDATIEERTEYVRGIMNFLEQAEFLLERGFLTNRQVNRLHNEVVNGVMRSRRNKVRK